MMRAITLGFAVAMAAATLPATTTQAWAGPELHRQLAAPFSSKATIYRPDCWTLEDPFNLCDAVGGRIKE